MSADKPPARPTTDTKSTSTKSDSAKTNETKKTDAPKTGTATRGEKSDATNGIRKAPEVQTTTPQPVAARRADGTGTGTETRVAKPSESGTTPASPTKAETTPPVGKSDANIGTRKAPEVQATTPRPVTAQRDTATGIRGEVHANPKPTEIRPAPNDKIAEGRQNLERPAEPVSKEQYPYLEKAKAGNNPESSRTREPQHLKESPLGKNPDGRAEPTANDRAAFSGPIQPFEMKAGTTYYRVVGDGQQAAGRWWSEKPPTNMDQIRGDSAVDSAYNGDHGLVAFTPSEDIKGWRGQASSQGTRNDKNSTDGSGEYLRGGGDQIWIPPGQHKGTYTIEPLNLR